MSLKSLVLVGVFGLLIAVALASVIATVAGQARSTTSQSATWMPPRTPDGQPDLQGVWDYRTVTPFERPKTVGDKQVLSDEEAAAFEEEINRAENRDLVDSKRGGAGYAPESE